MKRSETFERLTRELEHWPEVEVSHDWGGRHPRLILCHRGQRRMLIYTSTRTDFRGTRNAVAKLRHTLIEIGAERDRHP